MYFDYFWLVLQKTTHAAAGHADVAPIQWFQCGCPSGTLGRGQNSGFVVHSATKDGQTFAVKVSTECDEETVFKSGDWRRIKWSEQNWDEQLD